MIFKKSFFFDENKAFKLASQLVSGFRATSRMFKILIAFLNDFDIEKESINAYIKKKRYRVVCFIVGLENSF
jgi:hypothetical protein